MTKLTFLGTGTSQGVPVISCGCRVCSSPDSRDKRLRTAGTRSRQDGEMVLVIDAGPDFRQQMLRANMCNVLDGILLTHEHKDHIGGLDDVRAFNYTSGEPVDIYAEERVQTGGENRISTMHSLSIKYPGVPEIRSPYDSRRRAFLRRDRAWRSFRSADMHYKLPVLGFRIGAYCLPDRFQPTFRPARVRQTTKASIRW